MLPKSPPAVAWWSQFSRPFRPQKPSERPLAPLSFSKENNLTLYTLQGSVRDAWAGRRHRRSPSRREPKAFIQADSQELSNFHIDASLWPFTESLDLKGRSRDAFCQIQILLEMEWSSGWLACTATLREYYH